MRVSGESLQCAWEECACAGGGVEGGEEEGRVVKVEGGGLGVFLEGCLEEVVCFLCEC